MKLPHPIFGLIAALIFMLAFAACGPVSARSTNRFTLIIHDDTGTQEDLPVTVTQPWGVSTEIVSVPPNGEGILVIGDTPIDITIDGFWLLGPTQTLRGTQTWDATSYGGWSTWHVLYPSGVAFGQFRQ